MSTLAGGLGEGTVLVFQPATPDGVGLEVAVGIQRLWQKTLKHAGRPAVCMLAMTRVEAIHGPVQDGLPLAVGDAGVASLEGFPDMTTNAAMVRARESRWGLIATLAARVVVAFVPELLGHLARLGAHDIQLAGWMRRVKMSVGVMPAGWDGLLGVISRARGS